jgi:transcriptional regulator with XRE-family HTH domain
MPVAKRPSAKRRRPLLSAAIGVAIRELRVEQGISQRELAKRSELNRNWLGLVERGDVNPSIDNLAIVADTLGIRVSELVTRAERLL